MDSYDKIGESLNVETEIVPSKEVKSIEKPSGTEDTEKDYRYSRAQLYSLVEKGQEAVDGLLEVAASSDHPRAYEVAGQLIKNVADVADKLTDLHKKMKDLDADTGPKTVTNNALYVGSTAELLKALKENNKKEG